MLRIRPESDSEKAFFPVPNYALLISPRAEAAYFHRVVEVAQAELQMQSAVMQRGSMVFLCVEAGDSELPRLLRLSFVQGAFAMDDGFAPVDQGPDLALHPDFVWGEKYRGKTNETLTQLLVNLCLTEVPDAKRLFDPMCGRGTTCLWAMRYGLSSVGVEQEPRALEDIRRGLKKWTKLHRQKHKLSEGWVQKANKKGAGKYLEIAAEGAVMRIITGDTRNAHDLLQRKPVDIIATDIPYGVQHTDGRDSRNPLELLSEAAGAWAQCLASGGAMAIAFNSYIPKRADLVAVFADAGLEPVETDLSHRMSESILRDVAMFRKLG